MADRILSASDAKRIARRSYALQTLLNYRTMQGGGYLFSLWPLLRSLPHSGELSARAAGYINSHPVFAGYAQGAIFRRLEDADYSDAAEYDAWRESLSGPLGLAGDQLIWDRWKPLVFAGGTIPIMLWPSVATWAMVAVLCVSLYNIPLYRLRVWAIRRGYELGREALTALGEPWIPRMRKRLTRIGLVVAGLLLGAAGYMSSGGHITHLLQFITGFGLMYLGQKLRLTATLSLMISLTGAVVVGTLL